MESTRLHASPAAARSDMVEQQLRRRGVANPAVLAAMRKVPREKFVLPESLHLAYADQAIGIGFDQTISQPYVVAMMAAALDVQRGDRVLEVGAGSGYAAAVLAEMGATVWTIERVPALAARAEANLRAAGISRVTVLCGDGTRGWPQEAPFDAISVAAGAASVPTALRQQLAIGGRLVMPVGDTDDKQLLRIVRLDTDRYESHSLGIVRFVPLVADG